MNTKVEQTDSSLSMADLAIYVLSGALVAGGVAGWYLLDWPTPICVLLVILSIIAAVAAFSFTAKGREGKEFLSESMFELRKVVWPTQEETRKTTIVVMIVVIIVSLILALFDWVISIGVRALLGH